MVKNIIWFERNIRSPNMNVNILDQNLDMASTLRVRQLYQMI